MKKTLSVGVMIAVVAICFAQDKPVITVLDFTASGIARQEVVVFIDYVTSHIVNTGDYRVIDRMQREALLKEIEFSQADCSDENCQLEIGKQLSANQIIVGSIGQVGTRYLLNMKLIDVQTGETLQTGSEKYATMDKMIDDSGKLVRAFLAVGPPVRTGVARQVSPAAKAVGIALLAGGISSILGGGGTFYFYYRDDQTADSLLTDYTAATADYQTRWDAFAAAYRTSRTFLWTSIGLWAGGAVATAIAVPLLMGKAQPAADVALAVLPLPDGVRISFRLGL